MNKYHSPISYMYHGLRILYMWSSEQQNQNTYGNGVKTYEQ